MENFQGNLNENTEPFYKIYIVESPSDKDLLDGRIEGKALSSILDLAQIPYEYFLVTTSQTLIQVFETIKEDVLELKDEYMFVWPIIHLSCHGCETGFGLTDNTFVEWSNLYELLSIVNICFEEIDFVSPILLSMSSCYGLHVIKSDWEKNGDKSPFAYVLGHENAIPWDDALIGFSVFFHHFVNKKTTSIKALNCMNASLDSKDYFKLFNSQECYELLKEGK